MAKTWLTRQTRQRLILHTTADQTFEGILWETFPDGVLLRDAALVVGDKGQKTPLAGEVWIPRLTVLFVQHDVA